MSDSLSLTLPRWDAKIKVRRRLRKPKRPSPLRALAVLLALVAGVRFAGGDIMDGALCSLDAFFAWEMDRSIRAGRNDARLLVCSMGTIVIMMIALIR